MKPPMQERSLVSISSQKRMVKLNNVWVVRDPPRWWEPVVAYGCWKVKGIIWPTNLTTMTALIGEPVAHDVSHDPSRSSVEERLEMNVRL